MTRLAHVHGEYGVVCDLYVVFLNYISYLSDWTIKVN